ncbi:MAG: hypothetical protein LBI05_04435, partial [Planctomycetaceae bacterium]|nr:hypothetical protein [Planctomycetaceae bacterium]
GIFQYTYAHKVEAEPQKLTGYFDMDVQALQLVHSPACSAMFMRGLVEPAAPFWYCYLTAEKEIEILTQKLTPHALNFSGLVLEGWDINATFHKVALKITANPDITGEGANIFGRNDLHWNDEQKDACYFTVNAPDVKVLTGFVKDRAFAFDDIKLKPGKTTLDYATISLLKLDGGGYLLTATGTMHNTNGEPQRQEPANAWEANDMVTLKDQWGDAPVLCEGVPLELELPKGTWLVYPLDESGNRRDDVPLRFENVPIQVGPEYKTLWYEIRPM